MSRDSSFVLSLGLGFTLAITAVSPLRAQNKKSFAGKEPGDEWDGNGLKMKFCWCPPGKFVMGSPKHEAGRFENEQQAFVTLSRGFWMGKYEVTQAKWDRVMDTNPSKFKGKDLPVEQVSWYDATIFCKKLTKLEKDRGKLPDGWEYRLPTDAQWEYACRGGTSLPYNFGDDPKKLDDYAWYGENSGRKTHGVGQKKPNRWGLHDMHGNVDEWCQDRYEPRLSGGTDPIIRGWDLIIVTSSRVIRGGAWGHAPRFCRSADRSYSTSDHSFSDRGFRVALVQASK